MWIDVLWKVAHSIHSMTKYKKRLLLRCIHHVKLGLINDMNHMHISGKEPSSVILRQTSLKAKPKGTDKIPEFTIQVNFKHGKL